MRREGTKPCPGECVAGVVRTWSAEDDSAIDNDCPVCDGEGRLPLNSTDRFLARREWLAEMGDRMREERRDE